MWGRRVLGVDKAGEAVLYYEYMSKYLLCPDPILLSGARLVSSRRDALHLEISELAEHCHMAVADLRMFELGRCIPQPSQAYALASTLEIDSDKFCEWAMAQLLLHPQLLASYAEQAMD